MIRRIGVLIVAAFTALPLYAKGAPKELNAYDFSKGLDSYHAGASLPDGFVQNSLNLLVDDKAPATKRQGYAISWSTKSYSYTGLWTYTDASNTTWQIVRSSDQITANNLAGTTVKIATVSVNNLVSEVNAFGSAYFVDQTQGVYYWNGSVLTAVPNSPFGSIITQFHNRLWVTGAAVPNGNLLYGSKYFDGTIWTTGLNATDPVQYPVGLNDNFDNVTAEYVYLDTLYLFKHYAIFALYGFDQTNFQISQITQECGCIDGNSIQTYNGGLKFVSLRGVETFNGYTCQRISDPIKNKVDPAISQAGFAQNSWVQQTQADWQSGTIIPTGYLSTTISPPTLVLSTQAAFSGVDTSSADFGLGSTVNLDTTSVPGDVKLATTTSSPSNQSQTSNCGVTCSWGTSYIGNPQWIAQSFTTDSQAQKLTTVKLFIGKIGSNNGCNTTLRIKNDSSNSPGSDILTTSVSGASMVLNGSWQTFSFSPTTLIPNTKYWIYLDGCGSVGVLDSWFFQTGNPYSNGSAKAQSAPVTSDSDFEFEVDVQGVQQYVPSGSILSRVFDVGFDTNTYLWNWGNINSSFDINGGSLTFRTQASSTSTGPWDDVAASTGSTIASATKRYIRYISSFTASSDQAQTPVLHEVDLNTTAMEKSSGTWKSPIKSLGPIVSFGNFSVNQLLNNGTINYSICSSTMATMSPLSACAVQTANSQITISTGTGGSGTYVQWFATFTVTSATQTPTLQSGTVQWYSGNKPVPMASTVWDNRYWLSLTTNTADTGNDTVLVLNSRGAWTYFDIHSGAFTQTKNSLYHADSLPSGNIFIDNQAYADNGAVINTILTTKDSSLGDLSQDDYLDTLYPSADNLGSCNMSFFYTPDKSTSTYSLGSVAQTEFANNASVRLAVPVDSSHQVFGKTFSYIATTSDSSCPWQFYGFKGIYVSRPTQ